MSFTMPSLRNYQCRLCAYVAHNSRMLTRHVVIVHSEKVFRCPICPFVTRYAANWYRHKRAQHGLAKVPTCEVCGFFANSIAELAQHREAVHPTDQVQGGPIADPFARGTQRSAAENDPYSFQLSPPRNTTVQDYNAGVEKTKEPTTSAFDNYQNVSGENVATNDSVTFSLPLDGSFLENDLNLQTQPVPQFKIQPPPPPNPSLNMTSYNGGTTTLSPLKIRRTYCCDLCGFVTGSPREFLYHQRDFHGVKMNVFECELCIYASKHIQKLQRHYGLVHRQKKRFDTSSTSAKQPIDNKSMSVKDGELSFTSKPSPIEPQVPSTPVPKPTKPKKEKPGLLKCPACSYHTRNKVLMTHHEKTVHYKKRFYHCYQCNYVTTEKGQYTKHIKYHNASKMQCEFCHFKSAYKWNMDRHMRNHMTGTKGEYNCTLCNFVTHSKQSLKFHSQNHHQFETMDGDDSLEMEEDPLMTDKPEQLEDVDSNWMNAGTDDFETIDVVEDLDPDSVENSSTGWDLRPTNKPQNLKCGTCNFVTTWPFELKKHEEMHKSDKKHSCPLCGMGFEHIAWLTKHLHRVHSGNAQAQSIAAAYELLKPVRRRRPNDSFSQNSTPAYNSSNQSASKIKKPGLARQSLLSSYLKSPVPKYPNTVPKARLTAKPPQAQYNFSMPSVNQNAFPKKRTFKRMNSCKKCNYKTKWISELEKHMRVHNDEKPFHCHKCNYHSRWKGDLTRHIAKYHGCKLPISNKAMPVPKLKLKKAMQQQMSQNNWENVSEDTTVVNDRPRNPNAKDHQDSPLDLTMSRFNIFQPASHSRVNGFRTDMVTRARRETCYNQNPGKTNSNSSYLNMLLTSEKSEPQPKSYTNASSEGTPSRHNGKKKYFCPFCAFNTSTASRFHVHVVQHYNKRPFMCSSCGHRSNWEWDITKHIRVKGCKDKDHNSACVLLTDETGRRNYEKYDKYLRDADPKPRVASRSAAKPVPSPQKAPEELRDNAYGFMNPSNSVSVSEEAPENIIVTPDLPFSQDMSEKPEVPNPNDQNWNENSETQNGNFKFFLCKHCKYKHSSKKVVISHLSVHAGVRPFRCRVCGLTSSWRNVIVQHIKTAHNGYMNDVEDRITYVQEGFVIRITSVKSNKYSGISAVSGKAMFNCKLCPYKCDKEVYIKFHMKQHKQREGAIYQCSFCPYFVKFKRTLVRHMKLHEAAESQEDSSFQDPNMMCEMNTRQPICDTTYSVPEYNDVYEQNEQQDEYPESDSIQIAYSQLQDSNSYDQQQHESEAYNQSCGPTNSYGQLQDSGSRYVDEQTAKRKRHVCEHCPYRTDNRTQYLYHKQFHRPNLSAPFKCSICTYWASMQHLLTQHMKVHRDNPIDNLPEEEMAYPSSPEHSQSSDSTDISPVYVQRGGLVTKMFQCRYCPMMNKKRANVRVHERMHGETTNDGKFTCSLCSYKCLGQGSLTNHMKMHHAGGQVNQTHNKARSSLPEPVRKKVFSYFCMRCPAVFKSSSDLYIHKTFHGSTLPFPCPQCDYRAKHRIHLQKHLQVHTEAYVSKRDASCGPPVVPSNNNRGEHARPTVTPMSTKKIDQMLLLELAEVKSFIRNPKVRGREKCKFCPAAFAKIPILTYHLLLHGSTGEFGCSQCDYATTRSTNLAAHVQLHGKMSSLSKRPPPKAFNCPKCPAVFDKNDRFERHFNLHGKNQRYVCEHCDYSVRYAANLVKHRKVHQNVEAIIPNSGGEEHDENNVSNNLVDSIVDPELQEGDTSQKDLSKSPDNDEEKKMYLCQRCPYIQPRKDAVQNHQNRHWQKGGLHCPYCDYRVMGLAFLQNHVRSHITPVDALSPHMYLKFENFKIIEPEENDSIFFEDKGSDVELIDRFVPALSKDDILLIAESDTANESLNDDKADSNSDTDQSLDEDMDLTGNGKDIEILDDDSMSTNVVQEFSFTTLEEIPPEYLPKVVLTNIFADSTDTVHLGNLIITKTAHDSYQIDTINKLSGRKSKSSSKSYSATTSIQNETPTTKSSLIVKIKVQNVMEDNNEKSTYSISTKKPEQIQSVPDETMNIIEEYTIDDQLTPPTTSSDIEICDDSIDTSVEIETTNDFKCSNASNDEQNIHFDENELSLCETPPQKLVIQQDSVSNTETTQANDILKQLNSMVNGVCVDSVKA